MYGTGAVSAAVAEVLVAQEVPFVLAGRSGERVERLARNVGTRYRSGGVEDFPALLDGVAGVINTAGPFRGTAPPLMRACVGAGVHYVDVSNEADVHQAAWALDGRARDAGVGVVAGAGLGTLFSERLIHALAAEIAHPVSGLLVTLPSGGGVKSPGVAASQNAVLSAQAVALVNGRIQTIRGRVRRLPAGFGARTGLIVGNGDVIALEHSTDLKTVAVAAGLDVSHGLLRVGLPFITAKARRSRSRPGKREDRASDALARPSADEPRVRLVAEVTGAEGARVRGRLSSRSGTAVAARTAVFAMATLVEEGRAGIHTAFQVLGDRALGDGYDPVIEIDDRPVG